MQWDPKATSYSYPMSMRGGLYCDDDVVGISMASFPGSTVWQKETDFPALLWALTGPAADFPDRDYCESAAGPVKAHNKAGKSVSFCQTVLPGNEDFPALLWALTGPAADSQ
jgi:hypothetical protein